MATRIIWIKKGYPSTGILELTRRGKNKAKAGDTIQWKIESDSGVRRITSIVEKPNSTDIFSTDPYEQGNHWKGVVDVNAQVGDVYIYSIHWKDEYDKTHIYDPKITVRPPSVFGSIIKFILLLLAAIFSIFTLTYLFRPKSRR